MAAVAEPESSRHRPQSFKMTKASKWRVGFLFMGVLLVVTVSALLIGQPSKALPLSLVFERYSTRTELYVPEVAFLWLTNASDKIYYLAMTGNADTRQPDTPIGFESTSTN